ncbi:ATP-dependent DNA helicase homolog RECG, chloroplastic isoform X1 [Morus notabilis]|uniref:ATP-dependent DNA helicase homolog RECG, chloroplastic isoform X1 n=1 Tax=Morus notabilis TaxID=981085 RepID=UPI000CECF212|nr:ATP-dependent DNA helicase homolog RECG, chloroplastic isoform X1 [Morus notabilis]
MAPAVFVMQSCGMCFSMKRMRSAIIFEAQRGYWSALGRNMRFNYFLYSKYSKICYRSKHKLVEKLVEEVDGYGLSNLCNRPKVLDKVSVMMGYDGLPDLIENGTDCFDVSLVRNRFPSIIVGSSPPVSLYDGTWDLCDRRSLLAVKGYEDFLSNSTSKEQMLNSLNETCDSPDSTFSSVETSSSRECYSYTTPLVSEPITLVPEENLNQPVTLEGSYALESQVNETPIELFLDKAISCIQGLRKKHCHQLEDAGFHTFRKVLHHFPRTYADLRNAQMGIEDGQYLIFIGKIVSSRGVRANSSFSFLEVVVSCDIANCDSNSENRVDSTDIEGNKTIYLHLKKFFRGTRFTFKPFLESLQKKHKEGDIVCVSGKVKTMHMKNHYEIREYNIDVLEDGKESSFHAEGRPYPIYPSKGGLKPTFLRDIIPSALQALPLNIDPIPEKVIQEFGLANLYDAYTGIHQPKSINEADLARKRLIFDEFFYLQLGRLFQMLEGLGTQIEKDGLLDKYRKPESNASYMREWSSITKKIVKTLPYSLTSSQLKAVSEIIWDLKQPVPMNRLLQGDVGCGKTIVAFLACMEVIGSGYQAAFMVPTELLAIQHYDHLNNLLESMEEVECKPSIALLTGSTPLKQSRMIRKDLQTGDISMVIGTHSLIAESVEFSALRIAVVDEQHRFGVIQRGRFNSKLCNTSISSRLPSENLDESSQTDKFMAPHVLAMSATPIPRTLALALYGDVSLTQITDLPPGRIPVETLTVEGNETGFENVYKIMLDELQGGGKVYLVYPVIEQSEQLPQLRAAAADFEAISCRFQDYSCGLLHGKMKSDEKDEALKLFRCGETHILLSTQVIEVGVDVPDASLMVVMNAERFGIAQLHQLRGRVGRGTRKSKCIFVASTATSLNRLKVLETSSDGFYLANVDLSLRGPGDLLGRKQSGHLPEFPIARLEVDGNLLQQAHLAALKILSASHDLEKFPLLKAELSMRHPLSFLGD